jgi:hypothetical protein
MALRTWAASRLNLFPARSSSGTPTFVDKLAALFVVQFGKAHCAPCAVGIY